MLKALELVEGDSLEETFVSFHMLPESPTVSVLGSKYSPGMVLKKPPLFLSKTKTVRMDIQSRSIYPEG